MKTDYSIIADQYDKNPLRQKPVDPEIGLLLQHKKELRILDLACGTGNYLMTQSSAYINNSIDWFGIDQSPEMLAYARKKNSNVQFFEGDAANTTIPGDDLDYIRNEYAFHHFSDKAGAANNIIGMLTNGGTFIMENICPDYMLNSWVYRYFPRARQIDTDRFYSASNIYQLFSGPGLKTTLDIQVSVFLLDFSERIKEVENRDMSQLTMISEKEYRKGLEQMKADYKNKRKLITDFAKIILKVIKK